MRNPVSFTIAIGGLFCWVISGFKAGHPSDIDARKGKYFLIGLGVIIGFILIWYLVVRYIFHIKASDLQKRI